MINQLENMMLPPNRKIVRSMENLLEIVLNLLLSIYENQQTQLFHSIMKVITVNRDYKRTSRNVNFRRRRRDKEEKELFP